MMVSVKAMNCNP